jgi:hypothetical protein
LNIDSGAASRSRCTEDKTASRSIRWKCCWRYGISSSRKGPKMRERRPKDCLARLWRQDGALLPMATHAIKRAAAHYACDTTNGQIGVLHEWSSAGLAGWGLPIMASVTLCRSVRPWSYSLAEARPPKASSGMACAERDCKRMAYRNTMILLCCRYIMAVGCVIT